MSAHGIASSHLLLAMTTSVLSAIVLIAFVIIKIRIGVVGFIGFQTKEKPRREIVGAS